MNTRTHTYTPHTHAHTLTHHTHTHTCMHTHTHAHTHANIHTTTHACTHKLTNTHARTCTHTHTADHHQATFCMNDTKYLGMSHRNLRVRREDNRWKGKTDEEFREETIEELQTFTNPRPAS